MGRIVDFLKNPLAGIAGANTKAGRQAKEATYAKPVYYGGSQEAAQQYRDTYSSGQARGQGYLQAGLGAGGQAVLDAAGTNQGVQRNLGQLRAQQGGVAAESGQGFNRNAAALEGLAANAPQNFQRTDQAAFQAQQDQAARQAQSIAASGGAGAMRTALATNQDAGAQAAQQAGVTRANEYNALLGLQTNAYGNLANAYSGRQQQATGQQASLLGAQGNLALGQGQLGVSQAGQGVNAGISTQGQYLGAESAANTGELQANQATEQARMESAKQQYKDKYQPIKSVLGGF